MIKINNQLLKDNDFITHYLDKIGSKIAKKFTGKNNHLAFPLNKLFTVQRLPISKGLIDWILCNPFSHTTFKDASAARFLSEYQAIKNFLLHGKEYYDFLKEMKYYKDDISQDDCPEFENKYLYAVRRKVINNFSSVIRLNIPEGAISDESTYFNFYSQIDAEFAAVNKVIGQFFTYSSISEELRFTILEKINVTVCPYCNRQWIDKYKNRKKAGKNVSIAQLDHIYSQKKFPLYAVTLANFVPSCAHCNMIIKNDHMFPFNYPYDGKSNKAKIFTYKVNKIEDFYGKSDATIDLVQRHGELQQHDFFNLKSIYNNHATLVAELLDKKKLRTDSYKQHLESIFLREWSDQELDLLLFNTTGSEEELTRKPLAKLTHDIIDF
ncbi:hypothetical protein PUG81_06660 [Erwiniaceae bacterium L1_54_6]|jgi:hypothetical protein|nr:hypothetical protein [Erwiniaceae bacterium L1_54_6]